MGFTVPLVLSVLGEAASGFLKSDLLAGIGALNTALSLIDRAKGLTKGEKHETKKIVRRMGEAVQTRLEREGSEADRQAYLGAATSAEIVLDGLVKSKEALVRAARCDADVLVAYVYDNGGAAMRRDVDQKAEGLFDDLLAIVADGLAGLARTSPDFLRHALLVSLDNQEALMGGQEAVLELVQRHGQDLSVVRQALDEIREGAPAGSELQAAVSRLSEVVAAKTKAAPAPETAGPLIRFGSPPARAAGFIGRDRQDDLYTALGRPEPADSQRQKDTVRPAHGSPEARGPNTDGAGRPAGDSGPSPDGGDRAGSSSGDNGGASPVGGPVVLSGMRGVGKSQLAAAYARDCEVAGWPLVAWMDASTRGQAVAGLAALAVEMGIDDEGGPEGLARRCVTRLNSREADRLVVFDNVEDFDDLAGLIPRGRGVRVLVTTTVSSPGDSAGRLIAVGTFTRPQSVDFIRERTGLEEADGPARLAEALGDLPVALAQAAATIKLNGYATIDEYLADLRKYRLEEVVDRASGEAYPSAVHAALRMAYTSVLDLLAEEDHARGEEGPARAGAGFTQLAALALLAPSGVPRPWLHRVGNSEPIARQAVGALVGHSVCALSEDGRYVRIHGLQGRVLREDYMRQPEVFADLEGAVIDLLKGIDMDKADTDDVQRTDALDMADQLRAIAEQQQGQAHYSPHEARINLSNVVDIVNDTIWDLTGMGRPQTALTLEDAIDMLIDALGPDHPDTLGTRSNLALAHHAAGHLSTAIDMFEALLADHTRVLVPDDPDTLTTRSNLALAHHAAGHLSTTIDMFEALLADRTRVLGPDHPDTLLARNNLALAHHAAGHLSTAIDMYEALLPDMTRLLGPDHPDTLTTRSNLATAHHAAGHLPTTIDMYGAVLADRTRILGPDHPDTLTTRNNLALAYRESGNLQKAIDMFEDVLADCTRILGPDHPDTLTTRNNLALAHQDAGLLSTAIDMFEDVLADCTRLLGPDHPHTLATRGNLAIAYRESGNLQKAIDIFEDVLADRTRILGPDHPNTLATRNNLANAHQESGNLQKAIAMHQALLTDSTRILGPDHPDTLGTRNNLANAHRQAGHISTAIAMYEDVLADMTRVLGPDHPHTLAVRSNLAAARKKAQQASSPHTDGEAKSPPPPES